MVGGGGNLIWIAPSFPFSHYVREVTIPNDFVQKHWSEKKKTHINRKLNIKFLNNGFIF